MNEDQLIAARQMYFAITNFSGVCVDPCPHDDCKFLLESAKHWKKLDPAFSQKSDHPRFDEDISAQKDPDLWWMNS